MCVITVDIKSLKFVVINFTHTRIYDFHQFKRPEYQLKVVSLMQL
jgi:hypothetical protein